MAGFLEGEFYESYLRKLIKRYRSRFEITSAEIGKQLSSYGQLSRTTHGSHLTFTLNPRMDDKLIAKRLSEVGVTTRPVSVCNPSVEGKINGLILGFGTFGSVEIQSAISKISDICKLMQNDALC